MESGIKRTPFPPPPPHPHPMATLVGLVVRVDYRRSGSIKRELQGIGFEEGKGTGWRGERRRDIETGAERERERQGLRERETGREREREGERERGEREREGEGEREREHYTVITGMISH